jgi:hypothetical protein
MQLRWWRTLALAVAIGLFATAAVRSLRAADGPATLAIQGRANANVSLASNGSSVVIVWSGALANGATDIYAATSRDAGGSFSAPVRVNSTNGEAFVKSERPPRVSIVRWQGDARQTDVVWSAQHGANTVLLTARSSDLGSTFASTSLVRGSEAGGDRGWESVAADSSGAVHVAWLDHRRLAERDSQMSATHNDGPAPPTRVTIPASAEMAELSQLYFATLDGSEPRAVTGGVCYCCKTAMAAGPAGEIYLAWRHVYPGNLRDIAFTSSRDGGKTFAPPVRVSEDTWAIAGCPEDGPVLAMDRQSRIHVVWPTVVSENGGMVKALFHAVSRDGRTFSQRMRLPSQGQANHPQMVLAGDGSLVVSWDESGGGSRRIALARGTPDVEGHVGFEPLASSGTRVGTYPALASVPEGFVVAWTAGDPAKSTIQIESVK